MREKHNHVLLIPTKIRGVICYHMITHGNLTNTMVKTKEDSFHSGGLSGSTFYNIVYNLT